MPGPTLRVPKRERERKSSQSEQIAPEHTAASMRKKDNMRRRRRAEDEERCEHRMRREGGREVRREGRGDPG